MICPQFQIKDRKELTVRVSAHRQFVFLQNFVKSSLGRRFTKDLRFCGQLLQKIKVNTIAGKGELEREGVNPIHFYATSLVKSNSWISRSWLLKKPAVYHISSSNTNLILQNFVQMQRLCLPTPLQLKLGMLIKGSVHHQVPTFKWPYCPRLPVCQKVNVNMLVNIISNSTKWWCTTGLTNYYYNDEGGLKIKFKSSHVCFCYSMTSRATATRTVYNDNKQKLPLVSCTES